MASSTSATFASYNILHPYYAVVGACKDAERAGLSGAVREALKTGIEGLSEKGLDSTPAELKAALKNGKEWMVYSNWDLRSPVVAKNVNLADVICLQEISKETIKTLQHITLGYELASEVYHSSEAPIKEYGNAILYKAEKVHLKKAFEIKHGDEGSSRSAACGLFEISGRIVEVASVHLKGYWPGQSDFEKKQQSKEAGYRELQTYVNGLEENVIGVDGIVVGGDFNEDPGEAEYDLYRPGFLLSSDYQYDQSLVVTEPSNGRRIDWVFYKPLDSRDVVTLSSMGLEKTQKQASDHLMTGTVVEWADS